MTDPTPAGERRMRFLTLNLWGAGEPVAARLAVVRAGLAELRPDVVALQEVREIPGQMENQASALARALGYHHAFGAAQAPGSPDRWGLAILSRQPIEEHATVDLPEPEPGERRVLLSARLAAPGAPLWVHTTHLNYRLQDGPQREKQVVVIAGAIAARAGDRPQIVMGDFNARPEADEIRFLRGWTALGGARACLQDAWARVHDSAPGWTWAAANPQARSLTFLDINRRIDYVFVTPERRDGRGRVLDCRVVFDQPDADGVFASDHFGVMADVQIDPS
jgi:endonuclease/exonuclease/phosphatase family metal-dependent hydrolase